MVARAAPVRDMQNVRAPRRPYQLPPGRHGLARSFVAHNQRERILAAVAEAASKTGFAGMSVQDIVTEAGVSRRTFYEQFRNKDAAFLAAFDEAAGRLLRAVRIANEGESHFAGRIAATLHTFLELLAASPAFARMCIVEVMAAGPDAVARRNRKLEEFAFMLDSTAKELLADDAPPPIVAETLIGGVYELVYRRIARGDIDELRLLAPEIVETVLLQYVGADEAGAQARSLERRLAQQP